MIEMESRIRDYLLENEAIDLVEVLGVASDPHRTFKLSLPIIEQDELEVASLAIGACHDLLGISPCALLIPGHLLIDGDRANSFLVVTWASEKKAHHGVWVRHPHAGWTKHSRQERILPAKWDDVLLGRASITKGPIHEKVRQLLIEDGLISSH